MKVAVSGSHLDAETSNLRATYVYLRIKLINLLQYNSVCILFVVNWARAARAPRARFGWAAGSIEGPFELILFFFLVKNQHF